MSSLPSFKSIQSSDFPEEYQDLINKLALLLNNEIQSVFTALTKGVSLADNILCTVATVPITVDANGNTTNSAQFAINIQNMKVAGCLVIKVLNTTNSAIYPTGAPFISFTAGTQNVTINNITGLQTGYQWSVTVLAFGT